MASTSNDLPQLIDLPEPVPPVPAPDVAPPRPPLARAVRLALAYLIALTIAESLTTLGAPQVGLVLHGLILVALLAHGALWAHGPERRLLLVLALAPLIRILSLSLPLPRFPFVYWYFLVGAPLLLAAILTARAADLKTDEIGLALGHGWRLQILVALAGLGLGYIEYTILRPAPLIPAFTWGQFWLPALILLVFTGFLEEYIFRGLMQRACIDSLGRRAGILFVAALFAVLHLGYHSALDMAFVFGVGLLFGLVVERTGSILSVTLSHGLTNIMLFLVVPFLVAH